MTTLTPKQMEALQQGVNATKALYFPTSKMMVVQVKVIDENELYVRLADAEHELYFSVYIPETNTRH